MGTKTRHFKALMKKNAINWKRTPFGSCLELLCPLLLMLILVYVRSQVEGTINDETELLLLKKPVYPISSFNPETSEWEINLKTYFQSTADMNSFMQYNEYTNMNSSAFPLYQPLMDVQSPYAFYPAQCIHNSERDKERGRYNSPIIGYLRKGSAVEDDLIGQLSALFKAQRDNGSILSMAASDIVVTEDQIAQIAKQFGYNVTNATAILEQVNNNPEINIKGRLRTLGQLYFKEFASQEEIDEYISSKDYGSEENPGVCFIFSVLENEAGDKYEMELQFNDLWPGTYTAIPSQRRKQWQPNAFIPAWDDYQRWLTNGFSLMQNWAANAILKRKTGISDASIVTMVVPMKTPSYYTDDLAMILSAIMGFFWLLMYIPPLYRTVYRIVDEKESRAKESMFMMGLKPSQYWLSWLAYYTLVNIVITTTSWVPLYCYILRYTNWLIIWLSIFLFGQSLFGLILVAQSLFVRARAAAITCTMVYFGLAILIVLVNNPDSTTRNHKIAASISPGVAMGCLVQTIASFEASNVELNWANVAQEQDNYSMAIGFAMLTASIVVFYSIGFYLEMVMPKTFGKRRHPCFCLQPKTWRRNFRRGSRPDSPIGKVFGVTNEAGDKIHQIETFETKFLNKECYEPVSSEMGVLDQKSKVLSISDLKKTYENGFRAVDGINLKLFADQIFVLLGHNGAGKTTTLSMLTGLFGATEGSATVFGVDLFNDLDSVREFMGVCPQHDVLFSLLTPEEHLSLFFDFKGGDQKVKKTEIEKLIKDIGLDDKRKNYAYQLSGGNKRKLSVAISLCGGSKFVMLDEPTSGLDISARRSLWNMLREYKRDRIIVLTTHYMDEADVLGDRIGIMTAGRLTCLGTSLFLKNKFGVGYNMTLLKTTPKINTDVVAFLKQNLGPLVHLESEIQLEMTFQIPTEYAPKFSDFFGSFDEKLNQLGIKSYGVSITTLDDVFLKVGHLADPMSVAQKSIGDRSMIVDLEKNPEGRLDSVRNIDESDSVKTTGEMISSEKRSSFCSHLGAILVKRWNIYRRNLKALFIEMLLPVVIMVIGVYIANLNETYRAPSRIVSIDNYPTPQHTLLNSIPTNFSGSDVDMQLIGQLFDSEKWNVTYTQDLEALGQDYFSRQKNGRRMQGMPSNMPQNPNSGKVPMGPQKGGNPPLNGQPPNSQPPNGQPSMNGQPPNGQPPMNGQPPIDDQFPMNQPFFEQPFTFEELNVYLSLQKLSLWDFYQVTQGNLTSLENVFNETQDVFLNKMTLEDVLNLISEKVYEDAIRVLLNEIKVNLNSTVNDLLQAEIPTLDGLSKFGNEETINKTGLALLDLFARYEYDLYVNDSHFNDTLEVLSNQSLALKEKVAELKELHEVFIRQAINATKLGRLFNLNITNVTDLGHRLPEVWNVMYEDTYLFELIMLAANDSDTVSVLAQLEKAILVQDCMEICRILNLHDPETQQKLKYRVSQEVEKQLLDGTLPFELVKIVANNTDGADLLVHLEDVRTQEDFVALIKIQEMEVLDNLVTKLVNVVFQNHTLVEDMILEFYFNTTLPEDILPFAVKHTAKQYYNDSEVAAAVQSIAISENGNLTMANKTVLKAKATAWALVRTIFDRTPELKAGLDENNVTNFDEFIEKYQEVHITAIVHTELWQFYELVKNQNISNVDDLYTSSPKLAYFWLHPRYSAFFIDDLNTVEFDPDLSLLKNLEKVIKIHEMIATSDFNMTDFVALFDSENFGAFVENKTMWEMLAMQKKSMQDIVAMSTQDWQKFSTETVFGQLLSTTDKDQSSFLGQTSMEEFLKNKTAGEIASEAGLTFRRESSPQYRMLLGVTEIVISDADAVVIVANMDLSDVMSMNITGSYSFLAESMTQTVVKDFEANSLNDVLDLNSTLVAQIFVQALRGEAISYDVTDLVQVNVTTLANQLAQVQVLQAIDPNSTEIATILIDFALLEAANRTDGTLLSKLFLKSMTYKVGQAQLLDILIKQAITKTLVNSDLLPQNFAGVSMVELLDKLSTDDLINLVNMPVLAQIFEGILKNTTIGEFSSQNFSTSMLAPKAFSAQFSISEIINQDKIFDIIGNSDYAYLFGGEGYSTLSGKQVKYFFRQYVDEVFEFGINNANEMPYMYSSYEIFQANRDLQRYKFVTHVNASSSGSVAHFPQFMYENILKVATNNLNFEFKVRNTPFPVTYETTSQQQTGDAGSILFMTAVAYPLLCVSVVSYLVIERINNLKHMQVCSGMYTSAYWVGNFIFDTFKWAPTIGVTILCFYCYDIQYHAAWIVYALFPFANLPFTYVTSFIFTVDSAAQTFTMFFHFFTIVVLGSIVFVLRVSAKLGAIGDNLNYWVKIFPSSAIPSALYFEASGESLSKLREATTSVGGPIDPNKWAVANVSGDIIMSMSHFFFWTMILFLIEIGLAQRLRRFYATIFSRNFPKKADLVLDEDVKEEEKRVQNSKETMLVQVQNYRKVYMTGKGPCNPGKPLLAVENLTFGLKSGECFALLGVNGAGKSTMFKSLTGEIEATSGKVRVRDFDIATQFLQASKKMGYCPQNNAIFDHMTVEEHLYYFAKLKGIQSKDRKATIENVIALLHLKEQLKKSAGQLSGGNKRKLCVAIALIGCPEIILLDEPSSGMDPEARRFMWSVVSKISSQMSSAVILTTHSMEEAEALSTKMGIMVKGGIFKCFGSSQHIKNKFGRGYQIELKVRPIDTTNEDFQTVVTEFKFILDNQASTPAVNQGVINFELLRTFLIEKRCSAIVIDQIFLELKQINEDQDLVKLPLAQLNELIAAKVASELYVQSNIYDAITALAKDFQEVAMLEKYGNYIKVRIEKLHGKSIGFLFKLVQSIQKEYQMADYSVSQTTLEQIFQTFANLNFDDSVIVYSYNISIDYIERIEKKVIDFGADVGVPTPHISPSGSATSPVSSHDRTDHELIRNTPNVSIGKKFLAADTTVIEPCLPLHDDFTFEKGGFKLPKDSSRREESQPESPVQQEHTNSFPK